MPVYQSPSDQQRLERALEMSAVSSIREIYRHPNWTVNSIAVATNSLGHGAICGVCDSAGVIVYGVIGRAPSAYAAGGSFTGGLAEVCTNNNGTWVICGDSGQIQSSTNGTTWTSQRSGGSAPQSNNLTACAFGNGYYVAVGIGGIMWTCPNGSTGATWTQKSHALGTTDLASVMYVPELMGWICTNRSGQIQTCGADPTGTWTSRYTVPGTSPAFLWRSIAYNAAFGGVLALYRRNTNEVGFATSQDGVNWTTAGSTTANGWQTIDALRFTVMDRSIVVWDYLQSPNDLMVYVLKSSDLTGEKKFMGALGKFVVRQAKSVAGQLFVAGQVDGGPGFIAISHAFRPNTISEI